MINFLASNSMKILGVPLLPMPKDPKLSLSLCHSGIPSQAGAKHVYAVEASEMAEYAQKLIAGNPILAQRITVRSIS